MDAAGEGSSKKRNRQDGAKKTARKRKARTPKISSVSQLIQQLRQTVFPEPDTQATRVLQQTKHYILQLENTLDSLLKMKGHTLMEDDGSCSLEDIKEEYLQMISNDQGDSPAEPVGKDETDPVLLYLHPEIKRDLEESAEELKIENSTDALSSPDLVEFERYLRFYKQTVDMLIENRVVSPGQITYPVVSKAISGLWQELLQDGKTNIYQKSFSQVKNTATCSFSYPSDTGCTNGGVRDSGAESQEASSSFLSSTPEDILLDDAFDLAAGFLDRSANPTTSSPGSPIYESCPWGSPEGEKQLHQHISDFLKAKYSPATQASVPPCDYETVLLRCTETFDDDEDDL
ncbi:stimulated by retinoic acid gene 8 protein homolog isoform X2 [Rhinoderma darwinii]|uniref:stimulated by retinoic acid gene 8 protein homolog isoform X2 n=1 Tax=Rhinoderma darwinii TaxID=43563 RepID=UPI003F66C7C1